MMVEGYLKRLCRLFGLIALPAFAQDTITISNVTASAVTNQPISVARAFVQGEIAQFAAATVGATAVTTQCDVKNRWADGSLKFAIVSFVVPSIGAKSSVTVTFSNQATGNNTGALTSAGMLGAAYNFDGQIQLTGTASHNISARTILTNANAAAGCAAPTGGDIDGALATAGNYCVYWLQGPVVTAVLLEDRIGRDQDVNTDGTGTCPTPNGTNCPLHPIFEAWFYPQTGQVEIGYILEDQWASATATQSARDQTYSYVLTAGNTSPSNVYACGTSTAATNSCGVTTAETVLTRTRWHHRFCANGTGLGKWNSCENGVLKINNNWAYLSQTKTLPNWNPGYVFQAAGNASPTPTTFYTAWTNANTNKSDAINGNGTTGNGAGFYPGYHTVCGNSISITTGDGCANDIGFDQPGMSYYHGPLTTWDITTLISQDANMLNLTQWSADVSGDIPYWFREWDTPAQLGVSTSNSLYFDAPNNTVQPQGRMVSINDRWQIDTAYVTGAQGHCPTNYPSQYITYGGSGEDLGLWSQSGQAPQLDTSHMPNTSLAAYLLTGRYNYYEQVVMQGAHAIGSTGGLIACIFTNHLPTTSYSRGPRNGQLGYANIEDGDRTWAWAVREMELCAAFGVDGSPEQAYCLDKLRTNIAAAEGSRNLPCDIPTGTPVQLNYCSGTRNTFLAAYAYGQQQYSVNTGSGEGDQWGGTPFGGFFGGIDAYVSNGYVSCGNLTAASPPNCTIPGAADSTFGNAYTNVTIGWLDDLGFCPHTMTGRCQLLQFAENWYINAVMDPTGPGLGVLGAYVFTTQGCTVTIATAGNSCPGAGGTFVPITNVGCASKNTTTCGSGSLFQYLTTTGGTTGYQWPYAYRATGIALPAYYYCGDEGFMVESMAALSYGANYTSTANNPPMGAYVGNVGYSGLLAYNQLRTQIYTLGATRCANVSRSPKWDIMPRNTISTTVGWHKLPKTQMCSDTENSTYAAADNFPANSGVYTSFGNSFTAQCYGQFNDSNGAVFDTARNRLIHWGAGHNSSAGNDAYAVDLNNIGTQQPVMTRMMNPACPGILPGVSGNQGTNYCACPTTGPVSSVVAEANGSRCTFNSSGQLAGVNTLPACAISNVTASILGQGGPPPLCVGNCQAKYESKERSVAHESTDIPASPASARQ
jgi:hypothetical protein